MVDGLLRVHWEWPRVTQAPPCDLGVGQLAGSYGTPTVTPGPLCPGREPQPAMDMGGGVAPGCPNAIPGLSLLHTPCPSPLSTQSLSGAFCRQLMVLEGCRAHCAWASHAHLTERMWAQ